MIWQPQTRRSLRRASPLLEPLEGRLPLAGVAHAHLPGHLADVAAQVHGASDRQAAAVTARFDFRQGAQGWRAGFADLPVKHNATYELDSGIRRLPSEIGRGTGYLLQGNNRSDDLFMFLKRRLGPANGIRANQEYLASFRITLASDAPTGAAGIGGAPGESVYLKAGGSTVEPRAVPRRDGQLVMNVDKGDQSQGGPAATVAGDIANGQEPVSAGAQPYVSITRTVTHTVPIRADKSGHLWLLVGTDSGFEGLTRIYVQSIDVRLTPVRR